MTDVALSCAFDLEIGVDSLDPVERRIAPRHVVLEYRAWLGWKDGDNFHASAVRMLDISRAGVAIESEDAPPIDAEVEFCLSQGKERDCIAGQVVGTSRTTRRAHLVRIAFWEPCPDRLYHAALHGLSD